MTYRVLPTPLHPVADHVRSFLQGRGVSMIVIEAEVHPDLKLRPTLQGRTQDHHIVCAEVTDAGYTDALDAFVLDSQRLGLPIKFSIAVPTGSPPDVASLLRRAKSRGVGVVEVGPNGGCHVFDNALSLSLTALRRLELNRFPQRYRQALLDAEDTFLNGDPVKGCSRIFDEIEEFTRRLGVKALKKGLLNASAKAVAKPNFAKDPWKGLLEYLKKHLNYGAFAALSDQLISRIIGLTPYRNQTGHKVSRRQDLIRRDRQLRTRFEDAVDALEDLVIATKGHRI